LLAIGHTGDPYVVKDSRKVIEIAEAFAAGGLPVLMEWMSGGVQTPMVSLTKQLIRFLNDIAPQPASSE
jgi:hypothetical protein